MGDAPPSLARTRRHRVDTVAPFYPANSVIDTQAGLFPNG